MLYPEIALSGGRYKKYLENQLGMVLKQDNNLDIVGRQI